ncbi:hypothetical protein [Streptomyces sp. NRRL S-455]|uniref:hypothetical protein n=1 Tax=Streptomyces sp. NRRL S-455 TaxID=1463908 RepID=UPI0004BEA836|nr:hypothetical protein [Streptomyces sp. NRRL S-455]
MQRTSADEEDRQSVAQFGCTVQGAYDRFSDVLDERGVRAKRYGPNRGGPATDRQKAYLRSLLAQHAGSETAEAIRNYFNCCRLVRRPISFGDVAEAIEALRSLSD